MEKPLSVIHLDELMQFDHVVMVSEDGTISEPSGIYCDAELNVMTNGEDDFYLPTGWEFAEGLYRPIRL